MCGIKFDLIGADTEISSEDSLLQEASNSRYKSVCLAIIKFLFCITYGHNTLNQIFGYCRKLRFNNRNCHIST